jgi:hypothetical protein
MKDTSRIGSVAHFAVVHKLLKLGYNVLQPINEGLIYDLVVEVQGEFKKVQCKSGVYKAGSVIFRNYTNKRSGLIKYGNDVDYYGVYCANLDSTYLIPVDQCAGVTTALRVEEKRSKIKSGVRWASEFKI